MSKEKKPKAKKADKTEEKAKTTKAKTTKAKTTKAKAEAKPKTTKAKAEAKPKETKPKAEAKPKETKPEAEAKPAESKQKYKPENTIFVGNKPAMTYVLAIMTCFNENKAKEVQICARGRAISTAVDVAELTRNRFMSELKVKSIITSTEQVVRREGGGVANVSAIEITLAK